MTLTGGKGDPVATMALPSDHVKASSAVHSDRVSGFERGKIMGRSLVSVIKITENEEED